MKHLTSLCIVAAGALLSCFAATAREPIAMGQRGLVLDGNGNVRGAQGSAFSTAEGQGARTRRVSRNDDGSASASGQASASGTRGSAERSGSYTRNADGSASGERSTSVTNANTGTTLDGSTTYTKGSGVTRSASCTDASGNTVSCGSR